MDADGNHAAPAFGYLTVLEGPPHGLFGGYLVLSPLGRPLEFRCSTPVAPSRAQQILYGPTLRPYLLAEVIGQALVSASELPVRLILTDQSDMLPLGRMRDECIVYVEPMAADAPAVAGAQCDLGGCRLTLAEGAPIGVDQLPTLLRPLTSHVDLCEPFGRIAAALTEAQLASQDVADGVAGHAAAA
jgi:hypothetical protein